MEGRRMGETIKGRDLLSYLYLLEIQKYIMNYNSSHFVHKFILTHQSGFYMSGRAVIQAWDRVDVSVGQIERPVQVCAFCN